MLHGEPVRLNKRNLLKTHVRSTVFTNTVTLLRFNYYTADGRLIGAKVKTKDKQFKYEGETEGTLFGQHLFPKQESVLSSLKVN